MQPSPGMPPFAPARWLVVWAALIGSAASVQVGAWALTPARAAEMPDSRDGDAALTDVPGDHDSLAEARRLVQQLGDPNLQRRDAASRRLVQMGTAAVQATTEGLRHADAEVRQRCRKILENVSRRVHQRQLAEFIEHPERNVRLPGWERFRAVVGDDATARGLFVDIQKAEPALLRLSEQQDRRRLDERLIERCRSLYQESTQTFGRGQLISVDSVAALLFITSDKETRPSTEAIALLQMFLFQQGAREAIANGPRKDALKELVSYWLESTADRADPRSHVQLAMMHDIPAGSKPAWRLLEQANAPPDHMLIALLAIGRFGTAAEIPKLEPFLNNKSMVMQQQRGNRVVETQVRDVALAVLVHLAGENLADYQLVHVEKAADTLYQPATLYFESDEARTAAIEKWRKRAEQ